MTLNVREREREREGERADTKCLTREREGERERAVFEYSCDTILVTIYQSSYSSCRMDGCLNYL